jgi:hypothetical protein
MRVGRMRRYGLDPMPIVPERPQLVQRRAKLRDARPMMSQGDDALLIAGIGPGLALSAILICRNDAR